MRPLRLHPLYEAEGTGNAGGQQSAQQPASGGNDPLVAFQNLLSRSSSAETLAHRLFEENYGHRSRIRELEQLVPAQGATVLSAEQAALWQAYQQLGAPDAVQTTIQQAQQLRRDLELRDVAAAANLQIDVLRTLAGDLAFEVKDETKDGRAIRTVYVKVDGKDIALEAYAAEKWAAFLPALRPAQMGQVGAPAIGATNPAGLHGQQPAKSFDLKNRPSLGSIEWKS